MHDNPNVMTLDEIWQRKSDGAVGAWLSLSKLVLMGLVVVISFVVPGPNQLQDSVFIVAITGWVAFGVVGLRRSHARRRRKHPRPENQLVWRVTSG